MTTKHSVAHSNVWEDPELDRVALKVKPGQSVISITSGGCNSLCLLLEDPGRVVSIDANPAQLAVIEYKRAAIMELEYEDFLESIGTPFYRKPSPNTGEHRISLYERIKKHMPEYAVNFWDQNRNLIRQGIFMCGKVELFFAFYRKVLGFLYDYELVEDLFRCSGVDAQREMYKKFRKKRWHFLNSMLLNKYVLSIVKGAHSFAQVDDNDLAGNLNRKIDKAMASFFNPDNFFMSLMLLGGHYSRTAMSPYLLEENFPKMKRNIGILEIYKGILTDVLNHYGKESFDALNMSNIFEWMTNETFNGVIRELIDLARPDARTCWRYTLAKPGLLDAENSKILVSEPELAKSLFDIDRSFIYEGFHVFQIKKKPITLDYALWPRISNVTRLSERPRTWISPRGITRYFSGVSLS